MGQGILGQPILAGPDFCTQPRRRGQLPIFAVASRGQQPLNHRPMALVLGRNRRANARSLLAYTKVAREAGLIPIDLPFRLLLLALKMGNCIYCSQGAVWFRFKNIGL